MDKRIVTFRSAVTKQPGGDGRTFNVTLSTSDVDREGDTIEASGWKFPADGVTCQLNHDHDVLKTVGRVVDLRVVGNALRGAIVLAPAGISSTIDETARRLAAGINRTVSVGFQPIRWEDSDAGVHFLEQELLELSIVAVPCLPQAQIDQRALKAWLATKPAARNRRFGKDVSADPVEISRLLEILATVGTNCSTAAAAFEKLQRPPMYGEPPQDVAALLTVIAQNMSAASVAAATVSDGAVKLGGSARSLGALGRAAGMLRVRAKSGARHSAADLQMLDDIHRTLVALGSTCARVAGTDDDADKQVLVLDHERAGKFIEVDGVRLSAEDFQRAVRQGTGDAFMAATGKVD